MSVKIIIPKFVEQNSWKLNKYITIMQSNLYLIFTFFLCTLTNSLQAQKLTSYGSSDTISIRSEAFNTDRQVIITKPKSVANAKFSSLIIYFDADDPDINGGVLQSTNNLTANKEMPKSILVGVMQKDRNVEFLTKDTLLTFLTKELIPYLRLENDFSSITLMGHSFGGYFATYAYFLNNDLFTSCIAISPAYWPNKQDIFQYVNSDEMKKRSGNFYIAMGDRRWDEISIRKYGLKMKELMKDEKTIRFTFDDLKGFSHNATPTVGFGLGLNYIFDEWEWGNILLEHERRLKTYPNFWGLLEVKGEALSHLNRRNEAVISYKEALKNIKNDEHLSKDEMKRETRNIKKKIKKVEISTFFNKNHK